ncbi:unnamed protein product, partial [Nesidiocoris tenuis]
MVAGKPRTSTNWEYFDKMLFVKDQIYSYQRHHEEIFCAMVAKMVAFISDASNQSQKLYNNLSREKCGHLPSCDVTLFPPGSVGGRCLVRLVHEYSHVPRSRYGRSVLSTPPAQRQNVVLPTDTIFHTYGIAYEDRITSENKACDIWGFRIQSRKLSLPGLLRSIRPIRCWSRSIRGVAQARMILSRSLEKEC